MGWLGDAVFGVVIFAFLIFGFRNGVSGGLFTAIGIVVAIALAVIFAAPLGRVLGDRFDWEEPTVSAVGFVILLVAGSLVFWGLREVVKRSAFLRQGGFWNSVLGTVFWGALGLIFVVLCLSVLLVSHRETFGKVAYERSAACRFVFDKVPVTRALKERVERPRPKRELTELEKLEKGFLHTTPDNDGSEADD